MCLLILFCCSQFLTCIPLFYTEYNHSLPMSLFLHRLLVGALFLFLAVPSTVMGRYLLMQSAMTGAVGLKTTTLPLQRHPSIFTVHRNLRLKGSRESQQVESDYIQLRKTKECTRNHVHWKTKTFLQDLCPSCRMLFSWLVINFVVSSLVLASGRCKCQSTRSH